jgi:hypothetical protein
MKKQRILIAAAAISLGISAISFAATPGGSPGGSANSDSRMKTECDDLSGPARDTCIQQQQNIARTPGRSEDAASRQGGRTPGQSEDSASRSGTPPGQFNQSPMGTPASGIMPKDSGNSSK